LDAQLPASAVSTASSLGEDVQGQETDGAGGRQEINVAGAGGRQVPRWWWDGG